MNRTLSHLLTCLYPRRWRVRYGDEFEEFLQTGRGGLRASANVVWSAFSEYIFPTQGGIMDPNPNSFRAILNTPALFFLSQCRSQPWQYCLSPQWTASFMERMALCVSRMKGPPPISGRYLWGDSSRYWRLRDQVAAARSQTDAGRPRPASRSRSGIHGPCLFSQSVTAVRSEPQERPEAFSLWKTFERQTLSRCR
jgi:hypothetical protein